MANNKKTRTLLCFDADTLENLWFDVEAVVVSERSQYD